MDKDNQLHKIQKASKDILIEVIRVCNENNIEYFIAFGSLLGTIRHHGFIPWDDDIDIGMTRENYENFLKIAPTALKEKYVLQEYRNEPNMAECFAKVRNTKTLMLENSDKNLPVNHGIFIDIFPFDNMPNDEKIRAKMKKRIELYRKLFILKKTRYVSTNHNKIKRLFLQIIKCITWILLLPFSRKYIFNKLQKLLTKYNNIDTEGVCCLGTNNYIYNSDLRPLKTMKFEDIDVCVPNNCDAVLKLAYGNYMELPPENQRTGHSPNKVIFEDEFESTSEN